jgi:hypothetical protein
MMSDDPRFQGLPNVSFWNGNFYCSDDTGRYETEVWDEAQERWRKMTEDEHHALNNRNVKNDT